MNITSNYKSLKNNILEPYFKTITEMKNVYIFGASRLGEKIAYYLKDKVDILGFVDNNKNIVGTQKNGITIFSLEQIANLDSTIIIASINYMFPIENQLKNAGFKNIIPFSLLTLLSADLKMHHPAYNGLAEDYVNNKNEYKKLYDLFEDEKSKKVLDTLIEYRKTYKTDLFSKICTSPCKQYFEDFFGNIPSVFVDGGAFDGDTVRQYLKFCSNPQKIYFFEPDKKSIEKAKADLKEYSNIINYFPYGLSDRKKLLTFDSRGDLGSLFTPEGDTKIECVNLDNIVEEDTAFIKLDIEGAEFDALIGAQRLLLNGSPLSICVYHRPSDVWQIPKLILKATNNNKYKFYLRHYSDSIFDTVFYAVPN